MKLPTEKTFAISASVIAAYTSLCEPVRSRTKDIVDARVTQSSTLHSRSVGAAGNHSGFLYPTDRVFGVLGSATLKITGKRPLLKSLEGGGA